MTPKFDELPTCLQERLLWEMELDYDSWESSRAEAVNDCMNDCISSTNKMIIENYCKAMTDATLLEHIDNRILTAKQSIAELEYFERTLTGTGA